MGSFELSDTACLGWSLVLGWIDVAKIDPSRWTVLLNGAIFSFGLPPAAYEGFSKDPIEWLGRFP